MTSDNMFPHSASVYNTLKNLAFFFYMKVDTDLGVNSRPALCARFAAYNASDNLGSP